MKKFSDFAEENDKNLSGEKAHIDDILNKDIVVYNYRTFQSKFQDKTCVQIQFKLIDENGKEGDEQVVFTNGSVLLNQLEKYKDQLPFAAQIKRERNKYYRFT